MLRDGRTMVAAIRLVNGIFVYNSVLYTRAEWNYVCVQAEIPTGYF